MTRLILGAGFALLLAACGGGEGGGVARPTMPQPPQTEATVTYQHIRDSADRETVIAFLRQATDGITLRHENAPTLRMVADSTARERRQVADAVRFVNSALPTDFRIRMGSDAPSGRVPNGEIWIDFAPLHEWPVDRGRATAFAQYQQFIVDPENPAFAVHIWLDKDKTDSRDAEWNTAFLVHEILHAVGFSGHVDRARFNSIMNPLIDHPQARPGQAADLLFPLDRDGLAALYMLRVGDNQDDLGLWNRYVRDIQGELDSVTFGVHARNWGLDPWVGGAKTQGDFRQIQGDATWEGRLVGFTPSVQAVLGSVDMTVNLENLTGNLAFDDLEYWAEGQAPGRVGSGATWGDGDLLYDIRVDGNTFTRTGGDTGVIDGAFYGVNHQAAGGTLDRHDLTAAFGAERGL